MNEEKKKSEIRLGLDRIATDLGRCADSFPDVTDRDTERKKSLMHTIAELKRLVEQVE